ncbi:partial Cyclic di-GMP phosphodiesterase, partial [Patescibacteria group bacterium]
SKQGKKSQEEGYSALFKVQVPVENLTLGMYVTELDRPWVDSPFLFQGFEIRTEKELEAIQDVCNYVYVDVTKRRNVSKEFVSHAHIETAKPKNPQAKKHIFAFTQLSENWDYGTPPQKLSQFEKEIERANKVYDNAQVVVENFMKNVENGGGIDSIAAQKAVAQCVRSILHSPDAMLWLAQLKAKDEYTAQHSLNVCILSIVLGRYINLSNRDLNLVGLCGMMHDVGKLLIPPEILQKTTPLTDEENRTLKTHTRLGYNLLKSSNMNSIVAVVALTHHEQLDGKGYPRRLMEHNISHFTKIVAITNAYDSMTNDKPNQRGKTHLEATHILTNLSGTHFDPTLVVKFIECIGVYPPGSLVEMTNGAVAMVLEVHEKAKLRPKVIMILDEQKKPVREHIIDLALMTKDNNGSVYTIKNIIKAKDWNLDVSKYYREGLLQKGFRLAQK